MELTTKQQELIELLNNSSSFDIQKFNEYQTQLNQLTNIVNADLKTQFTNMLNTTYNETLQSKNNFAKIFEKLFEIINIDNLTLSYTTTKNADGLTTTTTNFAFNAKNSSSSSSSSNKTYTNKEEFVKALTNLDKTFTVNYKNHTEKLTCNIENFEKKIEQVKEIYKNLDKKILASFYTCIEKL